MTVLQIYLVKKFSTSRMMYGESFGEGTMYVTGLYLTEYFDKACEGVFSGSDFHWQMTAGQVTERDLVCYLVESEYKSIVASHASGTLGGSGSTAWSTGKHAMISEVYMDVILGNPNLGRLLANIIYHELMHNKLDAHPTVIKDVHKIGGGLSTSGKINSSMRPSSTDTAWLKKGLQRSMKQYTGAI